MKTKIAITCFVIFLSNSLFSQAYIPFNKEGKMWTEFGDNGLGNTSIIMIEIVGDTIIGSKTYKIYSGLHLRNYIYEDTTNKKVYVYDDFYHQDTLWYDFSLQVGDSIHFEFYNLYVVNKQTEFFAGKNRMKFTLQIDEMPSVIYWYEGIGSTIGVFKSIEWVGGSSDLLCYFENDTLLYHNSTLSDTCFAITKIHEFQTEKQIIAYYSKGNLYVKSMNSIPYTVKLFDVFGREIKEITITGNVEINLSEFPKGAYLYMIECDDKINRCVNKILINE